MKTLGFMYTCFKEKKAVEHSLKHLVKIYPDSPIYLFSDGGDDFSYLEQEYKNLKTSLEKDTLSETFKITAGHTGCDYINGNFRQEHYQKIIKESAFATLDRIEKTIQYCNTDWIVMMDPDTLIRGELTIPDNATLLGSLVNCCFPENFQNIFKEIKGAKILTRWGASPYIFQSETFIKALTFFKSNEYLFEKFSKEYFGMYAHDILIPVLFALIGEEEKFNADIIECGRNPNWKNTSHPLVHQFEEYYE